MSQALTDEHALLLWQACAHADDVAEAALTGRLLTPSVSALSGFLHHRLLPYLAVEEEQLATNELHDEHLVRMLLSDHSRIRADVDNIEASTTRPLLAIAASAIVARLERHAEREEAWVSAGRNLSESAASCRR